MKRTKSRKLLYIHTYIYIYVFNYIQFYDHYIVSFNFFKRTKVSKHTCIFHKYISFFIHYKNIPYLIFLEIAGSARCSKRSTYEFSVQVAGENEYSAAFVLLVCVSASTSTSGLLRARYEKKENSRVIHHVLYESTSVDDITWLTWSIYTNASL